MISPFLLYFLACFFSLWKSWKTLSHPIPNTVPVQSNTPHNLWLLPVSILFRFFSQGVFWSTYNTVKFKILCYLKNHFPNIFQFFLKQINLIRIERDVSFCLISLFQNYFKVSKVRINNFLFKGPN